MTPNKANRKEINGVLRGFFGYDWRELQKDPDWVRDESQAVSKFCRAGQFLISPTTLMHASTPHAGKTNDMRLAVAARYVPTAITLYGDMKETNVVKELGGTITRSVWRGFGFWAQRLYAQSHPHAHDQRKGICELQSQMMSDRSHKFEL